MPTSRLHWKLERSRGGCTARLPKITVKVVPELSSPGKNIVKARVECPGFCITHQRKDYPYIEIFRSNEQEAANQGKTNDANTTKYAVRVVHLTLTSSSFQTSS